MMRNEGPFGEKMTRLVATLDGQFAESAKLEKVIRANLKGLDYGGWEAEQGGRPEPPRAFRGHGASDPPAR